MKVIWRVLKTIAPYVLLYAVVAGVTLAFVAVCYTAIGLLEALS